VKLIGVLEGQAVIEWDNGTVSYYAKAAIDSDGSGPSHGDPDFQNDTKLHFNGTALNADVDRYIVVPPLIIRGVKPIIMGSQAYVKNLLNGKTATAVVGDEGPHNKLGEISVSLAKDLDIAWSPVHGGESRPVIAYWIRPGSPAIIGRKQYNLQAA
jgi:Fungal chitosanase of glycosyl hydrolase group 75